MVTHNNAYYFYIVVPGPEIAKQWKDSITTLINVKYHQNIEILTIHKVMEEFKIGRTYQSTLLVLDELHEYYTEERRKIITGEIFSTRFMLALTANYQDIENRYKTIEHILPVVDRIDSEEAIREGYISKYIEYNVGVYLTEQEAAKYKQLSELVSKNLSKFGHGSLTSASKVLETIAKKDMSFVMSIAYSNGWKPNMNMINARDSQIAEIWAPGKIIGYARSAIDAIRERKNLLYRSTNKLKEAVKVVIKFDELKTICFSQSTLYADTLAKHINHYYNELDPSKPNVCVVYHSQLNTIIETDPVTGKQKKKGKTVLKKEAIEAIRTGKARIISTASSLDRGFDVKDIRLALTTSGTQNPTQYNQRKGRALRKEDEDIIVLVVNLYARGTMDEKWLRTRQSKSKNLVYWVDDVNDINYSPRRNESFNIMEV